ncbi:DUF397 domain-containing protein [Actinoallomurus acanthiterrae]
MNPEKELSCLPWRKSTRSGEATNCVEVVVLESSVGNSR